MQETYTNSVWNAGFSVFFFFFSIFFLTQNFYHSKHFSIQVQTIFPLAKNIISAIQVRFGCDIIHQYTLPSFCLRLSVTYSMFFTPHHIKSPHLTLTSSHLFLWTRAGLVSVYICMSKILLLQVHMNTLWCCTKFINDKLSHSIKIYHTTIGLV